VWTLSGECVGEYYGHASFVFAVAAVPGTNLIASASEDHTVKLWHRTRLFVFVAADCSKHTQLIYSFIYIYIYLYLFFHLARGQVRTDVAAPDDGLVGGRAGEWRRRDGLC
jgi:WD40 repeat protein